MKQHETDPGEAKMDLVQVRVTTEQKERWKVLAEERGLSLSSWFRLLAREAEDFAGEQPELALSEPDVPQGGGANASRASGAEATSGSESAPLSEPGGKQGSGATRPEHAAPPAERPPVAPGLETGPGSESADAPSEQGAVNIMTALRAASRKPFRPDPKPEKKKR